MKRFIAIIITGIFALMFLLPNPSSAAEIKWGLKIGAVSAKLYGDVVEELEALLGEESKSRIGFSVGGFITFNIAKVFAIQFEILYTMKGIKYEGEIIGTTIKAWWELDYLEVPVLAKIIIPTKGGVKPYLFAGPAVALKLSGKMKTEYGGEPGEGDVEDMKGTDFGLVIGGGLDFGLGSSGRGSLSVDIRYNLGLFSISEFEGGDMKNGVFSLMVGYSF
jgi:hypothetical protein